MERDRVLLSLALVAGCAWCLGLVTQALNGHPSDEPIMRATSSTLDSAGSGTPDDVALQVEDAPRSAG